MSYPPARRAANLILSEALAYFMGDHWSNVSLARASGVSEGTIRNYLAPQKRDQGASGKAPSAKLAELDKIAHAMGLRVTDLLEDLSADERAALYRRRAAECYQRTGALPSWAPKTPPTPPEPMTAGGLPVGFVERRHTPAPPPMNVERRRGVTVYVHPQAHDPGAFPPPRPKPGTSSTPGKPRTPGKPSAKR